MRVMLIDDDKDNLKLLGECLEINGHSTVQFFDGSEAVDKFSPGCVDVVITDINMPRVNGIEVLKQIRHIDPDAVVIMLTGFADVENSISSLNNGAHTLLQKPLKISDLLATLVQAEVFIEHRNEIRSKAIRFEEASEDLDKTFLELQNHVVALDQVQSVIGKIHQSIDLDQILTEILADMTHLLDCELGVVSFKNENRSYCRFHTRSDAQHSLRCNLSNNLLDMVPLREWRNHQTAWVDNNPSGEIRRTMDIYGIDVENMVAAPLVQNGRSIGVLAGFNKDGGFTAHDKFMVNMVGTIAVMAIFNNGLIDQLKHLFETTIVSLVKTIDAKDSYTCGHTGRVSDYTQLIARSMGWNEEQLEQAYIGTQFHDIGKIGIPDQVLKKTGKLTGEEYELMKSHVNIGYEILKDIPQLSPMLDFVLCHHERWDGGGYPNGLAGEKIPLAGRIVCVADSYDAMRSDRSYRKALTQELAIAELVRGAGTQFDPEIAEILLALVGAGQADTIFKNVHQIAESRSA